MTTNQGRKIPPQINSIRAIVRIQTPPEYNPVTGEIEPENRFEFDTQEKAFWTTRDLLSITTSKSLNEPCGRATLEFTPEEIGGRTWASMIPRYSLVEIYLQRYPENQQPILVFLGLTDARQQSESYRQDGSVDRSVTICAREL